MDKPPTPDEVRAAVGILSQAARHVIPSLPLREAQQVLAAEDAMKRFTEQALKGPQDRASKGAGKSTAEL
jgi:hypothetical protein